MGSFSSLDDALKRFDAAAAAINRQLQELSRAPSVSATMRDVEAAAKSAIFVWLAGALETYLNELLRATLGEVELACRTAKDLHYRMFSIVCAGELQSLQELRGLKMWTRRVELLERLDSSVAVSFGSKLLPLDGSTLRPDHFRTVWKVLGFDGNPLPSPLHGLSLMDLADTRNRLAHGEDDPITVGRSKALPDVARLTLRIEEIALHTCLTAEDFLSNKRFLR